MRSSPSGSYLKEEQPHMHTSHGHAGLFTSTQALTTSSSFPYCKPYATHQLTSFLSFPTHSPINFIVFQSDLHCNASFLFRRSFLTFQLCVILHISLPTIDRLLQKECGILGSACLQSSCSHPNTTFPFHRYLVVFNI